MTIDLTGKVALVSASSRGIGFAVAKAFCAAGALVGISARDAAGLEKALAELRAAGARHVFAMAGDLRDPQFPAALAAGTARAFGQPVDILVNNSGGPPPGDILSHSDDAWIAALNGNLLSVIRMCAAVAPQMKRRGWGRIINLTSTTAREPAPGMALSNVTRAGVASYAKTLAHEVGPFGITVNTILTGAVFTERLQTLVRSQIAGTNESIDAAVGRIEQTIPVRRVATPEQFAQTVLFLASTDAAYLTGAAIPLDGGASKAVF